MVGLGLPDVLHAVVVDGPVGDLRHVVVVVGVAAHWFVVHDEAVLLRAPVALPLLPRQLEVVLLHAAPPPTVIVVLPLNAAETPRS